jgi:hypothetical protein
MEISVDFSGPRRVDALLEGFHCRLLPIPRQSIFLMQHVVLMTAV